MTRRVHLIVLIHGLYGNPDNLAVVKDELERASRHGASSKYQDREEDEVEDLLDHSSSASSSSSSSTRSRRNKRMDRLETKILVCKSFTGSHTWDGIDVNAHKAANEIDATIKESEGEGKAVEVFSIMGYSLGGRRYLVGLLQSRTPSFFEVHKPGTFSTFATPHIGTVRYGSRMNTIVNTIGKRLFSRSGQQLFRLDKNEDGRSLLSILADPNHIFFQALSKFPRIKIVANGCNDLTVPYPSGSISLTDPFVDHATNHIDIHLDQSNCVVDYSFPPTHPTPEEQLKERRVRREERLAEFEKTRHRVPPFIVLPFPGPLKHMAFLILPFLLPILLTWVILTLLVHTWQSTKRLRNYLHLHHHHHSHSHSGERTPLLTASTSDSARPSHIRFDSSSNPIPDTQEVPANRIPLLLDSDQVIMVRNLNRLPLEKVITFWPWCWNTHAMLVVRAAKRFKYQEEGRKVVRDWAEWTLEVGDEVALSA